MVTYNIKTLTPFTGEKNINVNFQTELDKYLENVIKTGMKQVILLENLTYNKKEFNEFIEQTLDLFLFSPNIFLEKNDSLKFYIKCALELEKKELSEKFKKIDNIKMQISFQNENNLFENILLFDNQKLYKSIALKSNLNFLCKMDSDIKPNKYNKIIKNLLKNEERFFNQKYSFFLLNSGKKLYSQDFYKNFNNVNFIIINEIYLFLHTLNCKNFKKLNKLLSNNNIPTVEKNLNFGIQENGKISPLNFLEIKLLS